MFLNPDRDQFGVVFPQLVAIRLQNWAANYKTDKGGRQSANVIERGVNGKNAFLAEYLAIYPDFCAC